MKYFYLCILLFTSLFSCSEERQIRNESLKQWKEPNGKIKTLSTTEMIHHLVKKIGGDKVDDIALIKGNLDPHSYQLVKGDNEKLAFADIIFSNGLGLEHGPSLHEFLRQNEKNVSLGNGIQNEFSNSIIIINKQVDPHIWMDIELFSKSIPFIVKALSQKDPNHQSLFQQNGEKLRKELLQKHLEIKNLLHSIPEEKRYLVTSHDAFYYFTKAYLATDEEIKNGMWQSRFQAPEGLAPDSQISPANIFEIINYIEKYNIKILFPESNVSKDSIKKIISSGNERGLNLTIATDPLYGDAMMTSFSDNPDEENSYTNMIFHNAKILKKYLQ